MSWLEEGVTALRTPPERFELPTPSLGRSVLRSRGSESFRALLPRLTGAEALSFARRELLYAARRSCSLSAPANSVHPHVRRAASVFCQTVI